MPLVWLLFFCQISQPEHLPCFSGAWFPSCELQELERESRFSCFLCIVDCFSLVPVSCFFFSSYSCSFLVSGSLRGWILLTITLHHFLSLSMDFFFILFLINIKIYNKCRKNWGSKWEVSTHFGSTYTKWEVSIYKMISGESISTLYFFIRLYSKSSTISLLRRVLILFA